MLRKWLQNWKKSPQLTEERTKQQQINISSFVRLRPLYRICVCLSVCGEQEEGASDVSHAWDEQPGQKTKRTPEHSLALLPYMRETDIRYMVDRCLSSQKNSLDTFSFNFSTFILFFPNNDLCLARRQPKIVTVGVFPLTLKLQIGKMSNGNASI